MTNFHKSNKTTKTNWNNYEKKKENKKILQNKVHKLDLPRAVVTVEQSLAMITTVTADGIAFYADFGCIKFQHNINVKNNTKNKHSWQLHP